MERARADLVRSHLHTAEFAPLSPIPGNTAHLLQLPGYTGERNELGRFAGGLTGYVAVVVVSNCEASLAVPTT